MESIFDFSNADPVRELAGAGERLVCLQFPEELGPLYCHSCLLSFSSSVIRNVLEDTQQQQEQMCTITLKDDSDASVWELALGLIYRLDTAAVTLDNAQALLQLAHRYDMRCITAEVGKFLLSKDTPATDSRLKQSLSPSTVSSWLVGASRSGLEQHVQLCIDYIVSQETHADFDLASLAPAHSNQLLAAMQRRLSEANSKLAQANKAVLEAKTFKKKIVKHLGSSNSVTTYHCTSCNKRWIGNDYVKCCDRLYTNPVQAVCLSL